ncbi:hypothetical protein BX600DRAFT_535629 [Xylariales sp. PMI_506]|nr:hypothetical protein BX600DRAFT_535629 [Xylariales sp. PMI_506]
MCPGPDCGPTPEYGSETDQQKGLAARGPGCPAPRSCRNCHNRKIRCDKKDPCSACTRAGRSCTYPPSGPRLRRTKKVMAEDMAARIATLEKDLAEARKEKKLSPRARDSKVANRSRSSRQAATSSSDPLAKRSRVGIPIQKGSPSQYLNDILLSKVLEERSPETILSTPPQTGPSLVSALSPFNALGILSSPSLSLSPASFHPSAELATRLWNIYKTKVDSCAGFKLLHVPTDEVRVYSVIYDPMIASPEDLSLCFAIYFTATMCLDDAELLYLGQDRTTLLFRFKVGLEQSFAHGNFLDCPTFTGLTALVVYLLALRLQNQGKGVWILMGLAIRIAQCLSLHHDGKRLGLSPFVTEIRRRLWWHLISRGSRAGEDYGVENTNGLLLRPDVDLPANVEDTDLYPEMSQSPKSKKCWTFMTASLIYIDIAKSMEKLGSIASCSTSPLPSEEVRAEIVGQARERVESLLEHCNPVLPQQCATKLWSRFLLRKLDFLTRLQWKLLQHNGSNEDFVTEENLTEALAVLEPRLFDDTVPQKLIASAKKAYPQYHVIMYILWHLCIKPDGPNADKAWQTIDTIFSVELGNEIPQGPGSKMAILVALKDKAMAVRAKTLLQREEEKAPDFNHHGQLAARNILPENSSSPTSLLANPEDNEFGLQSIVADWPNWATMVQGFQFDYTDMPWQ